MLCAKGKHGVSAYQSERLVFFRSLTLLENRPNSRVGARFFLKQFIRFWGQALQKRACRFQKGKALCLHTKPMRKRFHNFQSIPISIVLRSKTQKIIQKDKGCLQFYFQWNCRHFSEGRSLLQSAPLLRNNPPDCFTIHTPQSALRVNASEVVKKNEYRFIVQTEGFALWTPTSL